MRSRVVLDERACSFVVNLTTLSVRLAM